ncbi:unnamed protein product [Pseudo-nitzschia multistriata]|uniref:Uncharacterized protein n=1 Tax=Pseudo-nitzschia multistriata TaxID=183589 RepID=A0A448ZDW3_9STRA|nr:unnamed protein product [Pseudo-nitzschia multistriata]
MVSEKENGKQRRGRRHRRRQQSIFACSPSLSMAILVVSCSLPFDLDGVSGWTSGSIVVGRRTLLHRLTPVARTRLYANKGGEDEDLISEMDARILQSMLRDNKLDLEQTSNMKKLLERGVRKDKDFESIKELQERQKQEQKEEEDDTYSSEVIKTLANTKFWKALKRNAGEALESLAISVTNEIEKTAKVLVGLGFFAWDRAKQDVARALPTAASVPKKKVFQLEESSSYVEPPVESEEEKEIRTRAERAKSLRQEFTTPADEFSAVTAEISSIFKRANRQVEMKEDKSKDMGNPFFAAFVEEQSSREGGSGEDSSPFYASSTLSTTASRGNARLQSAFKKSQKTKLAQQKENPASKANRLASAAIDSAYQVRKEIQSEENVPGYKTKELRESTVDVSRRIAGAAKKTAGFLGGASAFLLGSEEPSKQAQLPSSDGAKVKAEPAEFLDDSAYFAFKREAPLQTEDLSGGTVIEGGGLPTPKKEESGGAFGFLSAISKRGRSGEAQQETDSNPVEDLSTGVVIEDGNVATPEKEKGGGAFGFFSAITNRGRQDQDRETEKESAEVFAPPPIAQETESITAEVLDIDSDGSFEYFDAETEGAKSEPFTTTSYLENMEAGTATEVASDEDLRQVTVEVVSDDDFDDSVFEQATAVDNISIEELLEQQAAEEAAENREPNFVTKATLRTLDVAFLVVEKGVSVAPEALEVAKRAVTRATEAKLKDSAGSKVGWEAHNGNVRGEKRY